MNEIKARNRGFGSAFREDGHSKLSVKFNDDQMSWLNREAEREGTSLGEIVRRAVAAVILAENEGVGHA
jgi:hypothetical protein